MLGVMLPSVKRDITLELSVNKQWDFLWSDRVASTFLRLVPASKASIERVPCS